MGLLHVAVQGFEVEAELAEVFGLEAADLQLDGAEAVETAVEEQQVEGEIATANLHGELGADEAEITAQLDQEVLQLEQKAPVQVGLGVLGGQVEELDQVGVLENRQGLGMGLPYHLGSLGWVKHRAFEQRALELAL